MLDSPNQPLVRTPPQQTGRSRSARRGDEDVVARCRAGHRDSFHAVVLRHKDRIFTLAFRLLGDRGDAEDLTQETFLRAYESLDRFRGDSRFSTWLYRICRNACLNRLSDRKRSVSVGLPPELIAGREARPPEQLMAKEQNRIVQSAISRLRPEFRDVIALYCTDTLSYEEIAESLEVPVGTVRSRLHRGREELKELLRDDFTRESA